MDQARNPYTPNAGAPPRYLAGRRTETDDFRMLLKRLLRGYTEQSLVVTGLRGVGKTVLLNRYREIAAEEGWASVDAEASKNVPFGPQWPTSRGGHSCRSRRGNGGASGDGGRRGSSGPSPCRCSPMVR